MVFCFLPYYFLFSVAKLRNKIKKQVLIAVIRVKKVKM